MSLLVFLGLLLNATVPIADSWLPPDFFLRLDPLAALLTSVAARQFLPSLLPGLVLLCLTLAAGRFFCGWLCPFGATLALAHKLTVRKKARKERLQLTQSVFRKIKYFALALMFGTAVLGVSTVFWGSPIPLITRFYALLLHPLLLLIADNMLTLGRPAFEALDLAELSYSNVALRRFDTLYFLLAFFALLFALERLYPRFWCRYLCPAGALLALMSHRPLWRRTVTGCAHCGHCERACPAGAISGNGEVTSHAECITCQTCVSVCPERGTRFALQGLAGQRTGHAAQTGLLPSRRAFLGAGGFGLLVAGMQYSGTHSLLHADSQGTIVSPDCIRPPGAVPESRFLALCLRCGECMKVCPSNSLQPAWLSAGAEGIFSPLLTPRRGPCEPGCNACGQVCPTHAIAALPLEEKRWAKVGTAVVNRQTCLAWAEGRGCVVCQEVCPYGAVKLMQGGEAKVPSPVVNAARCYGCGYCECHCPVRISAIVVQPLNALRLEGQSYSITGKSAGLELEIQSGDNAEGIPANKPQDGELPPGFSN